MSNVTFYEAHANDRGKLLTETLPGLIARLLLQIIGIWGNMSVAYATYKYKHLRTTCGILLSICAIGDSIHEASHDFFAYLIFTKINFTTLKTCVIVNILPILGLNTGCIMTMCLSIDRLVNVLFPISSRRISRNTYIAFYSLINVSVSVWISLVIYIEYKKFDSNTEVICLITDAMPGTSGSTWFLMSVIASAITVVCYIAVWFLLQFKSAKKHRSTKRMFKSLFTLGLIVFCTWMINGATNLGLTWAGASPVTSWIVSYDVGVIVNFACSVNYFVLLIFSKDYRIAFKAQLNMNVSIVENIAVSRGSQTMARVSTNKNQMLTT